VKRHHYPTQEAEEPNVTDDGKLPQSRPNGRLADGRDTDITSFGVALILHAVGVFPWLGTGLLLPRTGAPYPICLTEPIAGCGNLFTPSR
jgi:hypothetical protein